MWHRLVCRFATVSWALALAGPAHGIDVTLTPSPGVAGGYEARLAESFSAAGQFIPTWTFSAPVDGVVSVSLTGANLALLGYQFDGGPVQTFASEGLGSTTISGLVALAGPHTLLVGVQAAPALPPRTPATSSIAGLLTLRPTAPVPEPAAPWLLLAGLAATWARRRGTRHPGLRTGA